MSAFQKSTVFSLVGADEPDTLESDERSRGVAIQYVLIKTIGRGSSSRPALGDLVQTAF